MPTLNWIGKAAVVKHHKDVPFRLLEPVPELSCGDPASGNLIVQGDKTQIATVALAAHYGAPLLVVIGTTLGMLIADVPAVFVGNKFAEKIPMKLVHSIAAAIFAIMGVLTLLKAEKLFQ